MTTPAPLVAFDPATWSAVAGAALEAAGARYVSARPTTISVEWPVVPPVRRAGSDDDDGSSIPLELQQQDGGTLIVVALFAWTLSVTDANKKLVDLIAEALCRQHDRGNKSFIDINWQYNDEGQRHAPFSLDDYIHADGADWLEQLLTSARRFEMIFRALDPLVQQAAADVFDAGAAHVVVHALAERLAGRQHPAEIAQVREAFAAITMERFDDDGVLRAIKVDAAPEAALQALDDPLLAHVDEVSVYFEADAVVRWLAGPGLPRPLKVVDIAALDAEQPAVVGALLAPFQDCTHLSLQLDDEEHFKGVKAAAGRVPAFANLEVLELEVDASAAAEKKLLDLLFTHPMPKLRRFTLNSHGKRAATSLASILKRLPETVTELGLWQDDSTWTALRERLLAHKVMQRLTAVGVKDDVDEISDPRLADKKLFGPRSGVSDVAHDLHEVGRHRDVVDMLGPLRWKTRDPDVHARYAMSLAELDPEGGVAAWRAVRAIDPNDESATHNLANQLVLVGRLEEAYPVVVEALVQRPTESWMLRCMAVIWQARGNKAEAARWSEQFAQAAAEEVADADDDDVDGSSLYALACAQMWLQLPEVALRTLKDAVAAGLTGVTPRLDVEWAPVRTDPRWQHLVP